VKTSGGGGGYSTAKNLFEYGNEREAYYE